MAALLFIEETPNGVYLDRYSSSGEFAGDTWHRTLEDAKHQASYEYGEHVSPWTAVPEEIEDVVDFGLSDRRD
ncbi:MAG: hypothetical protein ACRDGT_06635 [Candidatus Limnocylindria bacterium]